MMLISNNTFDEAKTLEYDAYIACSGFEERASYQISHFEGQAKKKIVLGFTSEQSDLIRKKNDRKFLDANFESVTIDGDTNNIEWFQELIAERLQENPNQNEYRFYVDYSSMTRNMYGNILTVINNITIDKTIHVTFAYSHAKYSPTVDNEVLNRFVEPIYGYCNLSIPSKPTALIICLGNEKNRVYGLQEYFDAATFLFYSDSSYNSEFSEEVERVNYEILSNTNVDDVVRFPIHDLGYTNYLLENLCQVLLKKYRVVIAPCGPKVFTLLSMINSIKYESEIEVWRISPGSALPKINREATGLVSVITASFSNNHRFVKISS
jgi:hypothetical protein